VGTIVYSGAFFEICRGLVNSLWDSILLKSTGGLQELCIAREQSPPAPALEKREARKEFLLCTACVRKGQTICVHAWERQVTPGVCRVPGVRMGIRFRRRGLKGTIEF
jgi:hypothetical protein